MCNRVTQRMCLTTESWDVFMHTKQSHTHRCASTFTYIPIFDCGLLPGIKFCKSSSSSDLSNMAAVGWLVLACHSLRTALSRLVGFAGNCSYISSKKLWDNSSLRPNFCQYGHRSSTMYCSRSSSPIPKITIKTKTLLT